MALSNELWSEGMFLDGVYYATIAKNLSNGLGSFWFLPSIASSDVFHGHPPLAMGLQSIFFSIFGDSIYIERAYSLFTFLITGFFIHLIWKEVMGGKYSSYSWVVLFFLAIIPLNGWACSNNLLENTMNIFVAFSVFFLIKNIRTNDLVYIIRGYFARYGNISLDTDQSNQHKYLISFENGWSYKSERNAEGRYLQVETIFQKNRKRYKKNYEKIELNTNKLHLYRYKKQ